MKSRRTSSGAAMVTNLCCFAILSRTSTLVTLLLNHSLAVLILVIGMALSTWRRFGSRSTGRRGLTIVLYSSFLRLGGRIITGEVLVVPAAAAMTIFGGVSGRGFFSCLEGSVGGCLLACGIVGGNSTFIGSISRDGFGFGVFGLAGVFG